MKAVTFLAIGFVLGLPLGSARWHSESLALLGLIVLQGSMQFQETAPHV